MNATSSVPVKQSGNRFDRVLAVQDQAQIGKMCSEDRTQRRQNTDIRGGERPHRKIAGAAVRRLLCEPAGMLDSSENLLRFTQEDTAGASQRHMVTAALEKRHPHCRFELPNLLTK